MTLDPSRLCSQNQFAQVGWESLLTQISPLGKTTYCLEQEFIKAKTRPLPPLPPRLECAAAGPQSLKLKWGDSNAKMHAADDMVYTLQLEDRNKR